MKQILIVDDEVEMQKLITICIQSDDFAVSTASSGEEAIKLIEVSHFDLILLDIMMPSMSGFDLLKELKQKNIPIPVIIISAIGDTDDVVEGLNLGAYDYITKPFEPRELVARVHSVLRRFQQLNEGVARSILGITLNENGQTVTYNNKNIPFTKKEYQIFARLFSQPGRVYTREQLLLLEWDHADDRLNRNIDTHIKNIREKLKHAGVEQPLVKTVWGVGYRMSLEEASAE